MFNSGTALEHVLRLVYQPKVISCKENFFFASFNQNYTHMYIHTYV